MERRPPLRVAEFGVGTGAHALNFLDFVKARAPDAYAGAAYVAVDSSADACDAFLERLAPHGAVAAAVVGDAAGEWALPWGDDDAPVAIVALELLDNLPHDKVRWTADGILEARVVDGAETFAPAADRWVLDAAALAGDRGGGDEFLPTGALQFLARIRERTKTPRLFLADFDALPRPTGRDAVARNAPLVAAADRDLDSYLDATGDADIFFATDFDLLRRAWARLGGGDAETPTSADFFRRDPLSSETRTRGGYNPLLEDFLNTRVLLGVGD